MKRSTHTDALLAALDSISAAEDELEIAVAIDQIEKTLLALKIFKEKPTFDDLREMISLLTIVRTDRWP